MKDCDIVDILIKELGGSDNIRSITNCMTRLRVAVENEANVQEEKLRATEKVIKLVHDRANYYEIVVGPGNSSRFADICHEKGIGSESDSKHNRGSKSNSPKKHSFRESLKFFGDIFIPLIPGVITAGLCLGAASLISHLVPDYMEIKGLYLVWQLLSLISTAFMTYITAWCGYRAAEAFGSTPILGGMLGMITSLQGINEIAIILGLYNESAPLSSILQTGKGGILAVVFGVYIMSHVEKFIRKRMPASLDVVFTPLLTVLLCVVPYVLVIMPFFGLVSTGIAWVVNQACMTDNLFVRITVGYTSAALLLPLVACGMHHGLVALYAIQLQEFGYIMLFPALALAGGGQVGAAISLYVKARRLGHKKLRSVIAGALPPALIGIGEPLIYGVTLPMWRPFLAACLGAGFGGAFVMFAQVAGTTWGVSGLLGVLVMTAGKGGPVHSIIMYLIGYLISCGMGCVFASILVKDSDVTQALGGIDCDDSHKTVKHGEKISFDLINNRNENTADSDFSKNEEYDFEYVLKAPNGIHARPAGELAKIASGFDASITVRNGDSTASMKSTIEMMQLGTVNGSRLIIHVSGNDAKAAAEAVKQYLNENL